MNKEKPNILVIDDEQQICDLIKLFLEHTGLFENIIVANSVTVGLQKLQNQKFDLVIVDYLMPKKKGTEFISTLRKMLKYRNTKVLMISGYLNNGNMSEVIHLGVKNILVKPFYKSKLIDAICDILEIDYKPIVKK